MKNTKKYEIGINFQPMSEAKKFNAELTVNPFNKETVKNKTFEIPNDNVRIIIDKLDELKKIIKEQNIKSVAIENLNYQNKPEMWNLIRKQIIISLNEVDIPIIVYGEGENIEKPELNLTEKELINYKNYLNMHRHPNSSFEENSAWTNDSILKSLEEHNNDLGRVLQIMFMYQYAFGSDNMGTAYPKCKEYLMEDVKYGLNEAK